ncbi:MAG: hypothetical protein LBT98_01500 [Puniceicoccales bacterium]|jgi:hypothetical protein|nr:hypothetical protein [Puniceicoccales bacterium]
MEGQWTDWINDHCGGWGAVPWCWLLGLALCLWPLLALRRCRRTVAIGTGELGKITISLRALREAIRSCCLRAEERIRPRIAVCGRKDHLRVRICLRAPAGCSVQSIARRIQTLTIAQLRDQFGLGEDCTVDVRIAGFLPEERTVDLKPVDRAGCGCDRREGENSPRH